MVYNWDGHRDECYLVYVVQNKSMDELMDHMRIHHSFTPSKRAFQQQLRKWNFPSKQVGAHRNAPLVDRVRELWEANHSQADMLRVLHEEGYDVSARQLLRIRAHHRWLLRVPKNEAAVDGVDALVPRASLSDSFPVNDLQIAPGLQLNCQPSHSRQSPSPSSSSPTRKRRRQPDDDCSGVATARFPSETTLAESKALLGLDTEIYKYVRTCFQQICHKAGLESKSSAGQQSWDEAKALLVGQVPYLQGLMSMEVGRVHHLALDLICIDVTKRMRSHNASAAGATVRKLTLANVRNMLGVNPDEAREMRETLQNLLLGRDKIPSVGDEEWDELKGQWQDTCAVLRRILEDGEQREPRAKAVDILARDVFKRYKDHHAKVQENQVAIDHEQELQQPQLHMQAQPSPPLVPSDNDAVVDNHVWDMSIYNNNNNNALMHDSMIGNMSLQGMHGLGMPSMLHNSHIPPLDDPLLLAASTQNFLEQQYMNQIYTHQNQHHSPIAIYLQPHHASTVMADSSLWIATLMSPTLDDVRSAAVDKYPGAVCLFVEGVVKDSRNGLSGVSGLSQVPLPIGSDQELAAYLQHVQELGVAPTFSVQLHYCGFANYPLPKACPKTNYNHDVDKNPPLRGYSLAVASTFLERFPSLQTYFWSTTGFGTVKDIRHLDEAHARFLQASVIPLPAEGDATTARQTAAELTNPAAYPAQAAPRYHSAADYHAMYKSGAATPLQVATALLPYITGDRGAEHATAWTACKRDEVLAEARASTERWAAGKPIGVLDGVPFGVKCDTPVAGYVNTFGIKPQAGLSFFKKVQEEDCWPVKKMREAGAVMVGRLNMHEIGMDTTGCNPAIGTPTNWYNKSYYPGGSSSGGGSVLGAGLVPISIGTDAGGSVRIPAAFNGCFGLKVTHDRTMAMNSLMCVTGPLAATTSDLRAAYRVMAQPNPECEVQGRFAPTSCPPAAASSSRPKTLGVCKAWVELARPEVRACFDAAIAHLVEKQGYEVVEIELPYLREGQLGHAAACLVEAVDHQRMRHDPTAGDGGGWVDMLSYPSRVLLSIGQHTRAVDYIKIMQLRQLLMRHLAHLYSEKHPGMLIVSPLSALPGWPKDPADARFGVSDGNITFANMRYVWLSNMTGCPSVSAPMGYVEPKVGEGRVPVGIIAMGEWGEEESLLDWAADVEGYINSMEGGRPRPKEWVDVVKLAKETESEELEVGDVKVGKQREQKL
ncbi:hypothetical protein PpBr36_00696 [Pyricularia pennisetigena]|uniref:hypothetical protein n=1 Tax=Pyricularia pennisetigena TaxID=1578925 RepID=UPI00114F9606|nr:hypothetical protein PpBr36_00696 [Pyricularia pennisetigena]TLS28954.1 hypothetical protein PpBr36_00696 [Pyricularia pennisetigena]